MACEIRSNPDSTDYTASDTEQNNICTVIGADRQATWITLKEFAIMEIKEQPYFEVK